MQMKEKSSWIEKPDLDYQQKVLPRFIHLYDADRPVKERLGKCQPTLSALMRFNSGSFCKHSAGQLKKLSFLPPLVSSRTQISNGANRQPRTIINHLNILLEVGLIVRIPNQQGKVELILHPQLMVESPLLCQIKRWEEISQLPYNGLFTGQDWQILHPFHAIRKEGNNNSGVETGKNPVSTDNTPGNEPLGNGESETTPVSNQKLTPPPTLPARNGSANRGGARGRKKSPEMITQEQLLQFLDTFWWTACRLLYPKVDFLEGQHRLAKHLIWQNVYHQGERQWNADQWVSHHRYCLERLHLAHRYVNRSHQDKDRFIPAPHVYFDPNRPYGFEGTKEWYLREQTLRNQVRKQLLYQQSLQNVFEGKSRSPRRNRPQSAYEIWQVEKERVSRLRDAELMNAFYESTRDIDFPRR